MVLGHDLRMKITVEPAYLVELLKPAQLGDKLELLTKLAESLSSQDMIDAEQIWSPRVVCAIHQIRADDSSVAPSRRHPG